MQLNKKEIYRYLGSGTPDDILDKMISRAEQELDRAATPQQLSQKVSLQTVLPNRVLIDGQEVLSKSLAEHLSGCEEAFLMACTLGPGVDSLLKRYSVSEVPMVPVLQACAAEYTEIIAEQAQQQAQEYADAHGLYLRPRYSPGYGDFDLRCQALFFQLLPITKKIGITLTDSFLMLPFKSVTAIIGLSPDPSRCHVGKCMSCTAKNCPFRKEE